MSKLRTFRHENGRGRQHGRTLREGDGLLGPLRAARYGTEQSVPFAAIFERGYATPELPRLTWLRGKLIAEERDMAICTNAVKHLADEWVRRQAR